VRLGENIAIQTSGFGEVQTLNGVKVSLHAAGHILGSAQVRVEHEGEIWVFSGDYKTEPDATAENFECVPCHTFITETTFGLPIYRWLPQAEIFEQMNNWWRSNQQEGKASLLLGYSLGKAQRLLAGIDSTIGSIFVHGSITRLNECYRMAGRPIPDCRLASEVEKSFDFGSSLIVAPPSVQGTPWLRRFGSVGMGFASGWMTVRGAKRRRGVERGFTLSDHIDWPSLLATVKETGAERVMTTHGYADATSRYFREMGLDSQALATQFKGETLTGDPPPEVGTDEGPEGDEPIY